MCGVVVVLWEGGCCELLFFLLVDEFELMYQCQVVFDVLVFCDLVLVDLVDIGCDEVDCLFVFCCFVESVGEMFVEMQVYDDLVVCDDYLFDVIVQVWDCVVYCV